MTFLTAKETWYWQFLTLTVRRNRYRLHPGVPSERMSSRTAGFKRKIAVFNARTKKHGQKKKKKMIMPNHGAKARLPTIYIYIFIIALSDNNNYNIIKTTINIIKNR